MKISIVRELWFDRFELTYSSPVLDYEIDSQVKWSFPFGKRWSPNPQVTEHTQIIRCKSTVKSLGDTSASDFRAIINLQWQACFNNDINWFRRSRFFSLTAFSIPERKKSREKNTSKVGDASDSRDETFGQCQEQLDQGCFTSSGGATERNECKFKLNWFKAPGLGHLGYLCMRLYAGTVVI